MTGGRLRRIGALQGKRGTTFGFRTGISKGLMLSVVGLDAKRSQMGIFTA